MANGKTKTLKQRAARYVGVQGDKAWLAGRRSEIRRTTPEIAFLNDALSKAHISNARLHEEIKRLQGKVIGWVRCKDAKTVEYRHYMGSISIPPVDEGWIPVIEKFAMWPPNS